MLVSGLELKEKAKETCGAERISGAVKLFWMIF